MSQGDAVLFGGLPIIGALILGVAMLFRKGSGLALVGAIAASALWLVLGFVGIGSIGGPVLSFAGWVTFLFVGVAFLASGSRGLSIPHAGPQQNRLEAAVEGVAISVLHRQGYKVVFEGDRWLLSGPSIPHGQYVQSLDETYVIRSQC